MVLFSKNVRVYASSNLRFKRIIIKTQLREEIPKDLSKFKLIR